MVHRIRFQVRALDLKVHGPYPFRQQQLTFTAWRCGGKSVDWRGVEIVPNPITARRPLKERCHGCERPDR